MSNNLTICQLSELRPQGDGEGVQAGSVGETGPVEFYHPSQIFFRKEFFYKSGLVMITRIKNCLMSYGLNFDYFYFWVVCTLEAVKGGLALV